MQHQNVVRDTATLSVSGTVDGTNRRKRSGLPNRRRATLTRDVTVNETVMETAKGLVGPGQRLRIISATEVVVENR